MEEHAKLSGHMACIGICQICIKHEEKDLSEIEVANLICFYQEIAGIYTIMEKI